MEDKLNIVEILKDAPEGTKFWSPICGVCYFKEIRERSCTPIVCEAKYNGGYFHTICFTKDGRYDFDFVNGVCVLFPSKENRNWDTFKIPKKHKESEPLQRVLVREWCDCKSVWTISLYSHYDDALDRHCLLGSEHVEDDRIIPYEGNEDKLGKPVNK